MNLNDMLAARPNTRITTYTSTMERPSMGLFRNSGAHPKICCLKSCKLLLVPQSIKNPSVSGKVMLTSFSDQWLCFSMMNFEESYELSLSSNFTGILHSLLKTLNLLFSESYLAATRELQRIYGED